MEEDTAEQIKPLEPASTGAIDDKTLLRLFIVYRVLRSLGFSEARIEECVLKGLGPGDGWEEALDWVSGVASAHADMLRCGYIYRMRRLK